MRTGFDLCDWAVSRMLRMARWPRKIHVHNTNADEAEVNIDGLLAQAENIFRNPDMFLPAEQAVEMAA